MSNQYKPKFVKEAKHKYNCSTCGKPILEGTSYWFQYLGGEVTDKGANHLKEHSNCNIIAKDGTLKKGLV